MVEGWLARDKCGALWFYTSKPVRRGPIWASSEGKPDELPPVESMIRLSNNFTGKIPVVRWEDEPVRAKFNVIDLVAF